MEIYLDCGHFIVGEYIIIGDYDSGYEVRKVEDGENSDPLYENTSFEHCITWCLNS